MKKLNLSVLLSAPLISICYSLENKFLFKNFFFMYSKTQDVHTIYLSFYLLQKIENEKNFLKIYLPKKIEESETKLIPRNSDPSSIVPINSCVLLKSGVSIELFVLDVANNVNFFSCFVYLPLVILAIYSLYCHLTKKQNYVFDFFLKYREKILISVAALIIAQSTLNFIKLPIANHAIGKVSKEACESFNETRDSGEKIWEYDSKQLIKQRTEFERRIVETKKAPKKLTCNFEYSNEGLEFRKLHFLNVKTTINKINEVWNVKSKLEARLGSKSQSLRLKTKLKEVSSKFFNEPSFFNEKKNSFIQNHYNLFMGTMLDFGDVDSIIENADSFTNLPDATEWVAAYFVNSGDVNAPHIVKLLKESSEHSMANILYILKENQTKVSINPDGTDIDVFVEYLNLEKRLPRVANLLKKALKKNPVSELTPADIARQPKEYNTFYKQRKLMQIQWEEIKFGTKRLKSRVGEYKKRRLKSNFEEYQRRGRKFGFEKSNLGIKEQEVPHLVERQRNKAEKLNHDLQNELHGKEINLQKALKARNLQNELHERELEAEKEARVDLQKELQALFPKAEEGKPIENPIQELIKNKNSIRDVDLLDVIEEYEFPQKKEEAIKSSESEIVLETEPSSTDVFNNKESEKPLKIFKEKVLTDDQIRELIKNKSTIRDVDLFDVIEEYEVRQKEENAIKLRESEIVVATEPSLDNLKNSKDYQNDKGEILDKQHGSSRDNKNLSKPRFKP